METAADRLRAARDRAGYTTAKAAAEAMGVPVATYIQHENGSRGYPAAKAERYGRFYRVAPEWLLYSRGDPTDLPTTDSVPIVGYVSAGATLIRYGDGQGPFDYVQAPRISTPTTVGAAIEGVSLGPAFDQAVLFYDDVRSPVTTDQHGRLCIIGLPDGRVLVKILRPAQDGRYHLISNAAEEPLLNQEVEWAARVTEVRPR